MVASNVPLGYLLFELFAYWNDGELEQCRWPSYPGFSWSHVAWNMVAKSLLGDSNEPQVGQTMVLPLRAAVRIKHLQILLLSSSSQWQLLLLFEQRKLRLREINWSSQSGLSTWVSVDSKAPCYDGSYFNLAKVRKCVLFLSQFIISNHFTIFCVFQAIDSFQG